MTKLYDNKNLFKIKMFLQYYYLITRIVLPKWCHNFFNKNCSKFTTILYCKTIIDGHIFCVSKLLSLPTNK